ncbi:hypothetical protein vseg_001134 [Gypsophila vaccaria]
MSCCMYFMPKKLKKLLPSSSKKAWKSLTSSISPRLRNLPHLLNNKLPKLKPVCWSRRPLKGQRLHYKKKQYHHHHHFQQSSTVYVDKLYDNNNNNNNNNNSDYCSGVIMKGESSNNNSEIGNGSGYKTGQVKWKEYVSKLPMIRGVDERADEFIVRFRQQMQLQREQSLVEFQEMLARST